MPRRLLRAYSLWKTLPPSIQKAIESSSGPSPDSPPPINLIIGSNQILVEAAKEKASELGFDPQLASLALTGEAREAGTMIAQKLLECPPGGCVIMGGETTVTIHGEGRGGRNQELALAASLKMDGVDQVALISAASDGVDGPTDAAGGWVDGSTVREAKALDLDVASSLEDNNSYPLLDRLGRLVKVGPTGTNVNDLVVGLKYSNGSG
jgi:glycerate-2-kinase